MDPEITKLSGKRTSENNLQDLKTDSEVDAIMLTTETTQEKYVAGTTEAGENKR